MRSQRHLGTALLAGLVALGLGCDGTMNTGTAKKPVNNKPATDGTCPTGDSLCGTGAFAICANLQSDPAHCGACDRACSPGIACQAGVCQQTLCTSTAVPLSGQPLTGSAYPAYVSPYSPELIGQVFADVNGDGRLDRIEAFSQLGPNTQGGCTDCSVDPGEFRVSLGQPDGTFAAPDTYRADAAIERFFVTDVNGDGMSDLYVLSSNDFSGRTAAYHVELWLGGKDGHLHRSDASGGTLLGMSVSGYQAEMADLSGDGWPDLVIEAADEDVEAQPKIIIYLSDSTGALHPSQTFVAWAGRTFIRDMNRDGSPDLVLLWTTMQILYNRGDGTFSPPLNCGLAVGNGSWGGNGAIMEDFNRDGWTDLAIAEGLLESRNQVAVMLGLGQCGFTPVTSYVVPGTSLLYLRAADMNGDGILDLVSTSIVDRYDPIVPAGSSYVVTDNVVGVLLGKPDGTFQLSDDVISLGTAHVSAVSIAEVSGDARPDIVVVRSSDSGPPQTSTWENTCQ
jgi:hypothetical protein